MISAWNDRVAVVTRLERVVRRTLRAIERDRARVVVSADYRFLDLAIRLSPTMTLAGVTRAKSCIQF